MTVDVFHAADELVGRIERLHAAPRIAQRVLKLTRDTDYEVAAVVHTIEHDPALVAKLLRVVNSSRYGLGHNISSVRHAATYLGRRTLRLMTLGVLVESLMRNVRGRFYPEYWRRAFTTAVVSERLAQCRKDVLEDEAYTAGLLADVGMLVFAQLETKRYEPLYETLSHGMELIRGEEREFGYGHPLLGARLMLHWGLPEQLATAVANHHGTSTAAAPLDRTVHAAGLMADALWTPGTPHMASLRRLLQQDFQLDLDGFIDMANDCQRLIEETARAFQAPIRPAAAFRQLVEEAKRQFFETSVENAHDLDQLEEPLEHLPH
jgi:HD-like signal output (HDOD) protein